MAIPRAYHVVVHALEGRSGWTPMARFASTVAHALDGHLAYARYHAAGVARRRDGASEGVVARLVGDWLATDLNPATQVMGSLRCPANVVWALNAYTSSAQLGVHTTLTLSEPGKKDAPSLSLDRKLLVTADDPELCRFGVFSTMDILVSKARANARLSRQSEVSNLSSIARYLGVERSAAAEAALVFELEGQVSMTRVARLLGCHQRTLERRLSKEGVTAESLRRTTRLLGAVSRLGSLESLTTIAIDEGFSDLAHMSRAFKASCGMSPSLLRQAALGGVVLESSAATAAS